MTTTSTAVDHGISIETVHLPAGNPRRAVCLCGWQSEIVPSRPKAIAAGEQHHAEVSYGYPMSLKEVERERVAAYNDGYAAGVSTPCTPTRESHCSCGRPAPEVLDGGQFGPTGYCGTPRPPIDPSDCGQSVGPHDRSVCHVYSLEVWPIGDTVQSRAEQGDLELDENELDPYVDTCPTWCHLVDDGDGMTMFDSGRSHVGEGYCVPIRHLSASYDKGYAEGKEGSYMLGHAELYLQHPSLHREPRIHANLTGTSTGVKLALAEADALAILLAKLVSEARS